MVLDEASKAVTLFSDSVSSNEHYDELNFFFRKEGRAMILGLNNSFNKDNIIRNEKTWFISLFGQCFTLEITNPIEACWIKCFSRMCYVRVDSVEWMTIEHWQNTSDVTHFRQECMQVVLQIFTFTHGLNWMVCFIPLPIKVE